MFEKMIPPLTPPGVYLYQAVYTTGQVDMWVSWLLMDWFYLIALIMSDSGVNQVYIHHPQQQATTTLDI